MGVEALTAAQGQAPSPAGQASGRTGRAKRQTPRRLPTGPLPGRKRRSLALGRGQTFWPPWAFSWGTPRFICWAGFFGATLQAAASWVGFGPTRRRGRTAISSAGCSAAACIGFPWPFPPFLRSLASDVFPRSPCWALRWGCWPVSSSAPTRRAPPMGKATLAGPSGAPCFLLSLLAGSPAGALPAKGSNPSLPSSPLQTVKGSLSSASVGFARRVSDDLPFHARIAASPFLGPRRVRRHSRRTPLGPNLSSAVKGEP